MKKRPSVWKLESLVKWCVDGECLTNTDGDNWYPARPECPSSLQGRWRIAWMVFTGKADAVIWSGNQ